MKYLIYTIGILSLLTIFSCSKEKADKPFYARAQKNDKAWTPVEYNVYTMANSDVLTLIIRAVPDGTKLPEETLTVKFKPTGKGTYELVNEGTKFWNTVGLDVIIGEYALLANTTNNITIKNYNKDDNTISGTFNLTFYNVSPNVLTANLTFTGGDFYAKVSRP
jgi:hypothetical protein